mgnify:CR=1 FL=1
MARVFFPLTPDEIEATGKKFFSKHKALGKESPLNSLKDYDFASLGDKEFAEWSQLNQTAKDLDDQAKQLRERRDQIWKEKLKSAMTRGKDVVISISGGNPTIAIDWGFPTTKTPKRTVKKKAADPGGNTDNGGVTGGENTPPVNG